MDNKLAKSLHHTNPAAFIILKALHIGFPRPEEPTEYYSQAEALMLLRATSRLKREDMAFRLGISVQQYDRAESGSYGGKLTLDIIEKCYKMARMCNLPLMARFFHILKTHSKGHKQTSQKDNLKWWEEKDQ